MLSDPVSLFAALAGGIIGLLLMVRLGGWRVTSHESAATVGPQARPTEYASHHAPSAAPILTALGVAAIGIGLAVGTADGRLDFLPLIPGALLLVAALRSLLRRRPREGTEKTAVVSEEPTDPVGR